MRYLMLRLFVVRTFSDTKNRIKLRFPFLIGIRFYQYQHETRASEFCGNLGEFTRWRFVLVLKGATSKHALGGCDDIFFSDFEVGV